MRLRFKIFDVITYFFFLVYFISYIGEKTNVKYIGLVVFQMFLLLHIQKKQGILKYGHFNIVLIGVFVTLLISLLLNFSVGGAIKTFSLIDLFILTYYMFPRIKELKTIDENRIFTIITNSLLIALILAFILHNKDTNISLGRESSVGERHVFGFGVPSIVGFLCFVEITLSFYLLSCHQYKKIKDKMLIITKIVLPIIMIIMADIRSSMVSIALFFMLMFFYKLPKSKAKSALMIILFFLFFLLCVYFLSYSSIDMRKINYIFSRRFDYYQAAINEVFEKKGVLFGIGSFRNSEVADSSRIQIDNSFLDIFYQYGIVTLSMFVILIVKICKELGRIKEQEASNTKLSNYTIFINSYFLSVLGYSMVEKNLFSISSALSLITFLLIFWYFYQNKECLNI